MTERLDLFPTPVLMIRPPEAAQINESLLAAVRAERDSNPGVQRSNLGGWHSRNGMTTWGGPPARKLAELAIAAAGPHMVDVAPGSRPVVQWSVDMWANINQPGDSNQVHCHTGTFWSGTYYADPGGAEVEGCGGELVLEDPRYPGAFMVNPSILFRNPDRSPMPVQVTIRPEAGLLVLFPSWLRHSVRPHGGDRERVSIALNLGLTNAENAGNRTAER
jgi:uncharacterized protein (TIGR02466 family)